MKKISKKWFTFIETIIAITISMFIMWWLIYFMSTVNMEIRTTQNKTKIYLNLSELIDRINNLKNIFNSWSLVIDNPSWYDVILFTNSNKTSGAIIWIVDNNEDSNNYLKLDIQSNFTYYWNKVIWIQDLSQSQVNDILSDSSNVYNIKFNKDKLFLDLFMKNFNVTSYNSWNILESELEIYEAYYPWNYKKISSQLDSSIVSYYDIILNF
jgi:hypothetical protein